MIPSGERGFSTAEAAKAAAIKAKAESYVVIVQGSFRREFAWIGPVEFFLPRMARALMAGIGIVEMRK